MKLFSLILLFSALLRAQSFTEKGRVPGFNNPKAVAVSAEGNVYVADTGNNRIVILNSNGRPLRTIGGFGFEQDQFDAPSDIWCGSLINIYVADYNNRRIQRFDRQMNYISSLSADDAGDTDIQFTETASCAVSANNDLFILDHGEHKIVKINRLGQAELSFGTYISGAGELQNPVQLDITPKGLLLVTDAEAKALFVFDFFGNFVKALRDPRMKRPAGLTVAEDGSVLIADLEAGALFWVDAGLSRVSIVTLKTTRVPKHLQDAALLKDGSGYRMFLLDGNELLIGRFH